MRTAADEQREDLWAESVRRFYERRREENRAAWRDHYRRLAWALRARAGEYDEKVERLEEGA